MLNWSVGLEGAGYSGSGVGVAIGPLVPQLLPSVGLLGMTGSCDAVVGSGLPVSQETLCFGGRSST